MKSAIFQTLFTALAATALSAGEPLNPGYGISGYFTLDFPLQPGSISSTPVAGGRIEFSARVFAGAIEVRLLGTHKAGMHVALRDFRGRTISAIHSANGDVARLIIPRTPAGLYLVTVEARGFAAQSKKVMFVAP